MKNLQAKIFCFVLVIVFSLCYVSCTKKSVQETITIGVLEGPSAVSFIKMIDKEHFVDNKKVKIIVKDEPAQIQAMMMRNELDFAVIPTVMAANLYNKGVKYRMVACPIWGTLYMLTNDEDIRTLNDLTSKDVAVFGRGLTADILTQHILKQENVNCNSIDYRFNSNVELTQAFIAGEVKTAVISEPYVSMLLDQNPDIRIVRKLTPQRYTEDTGNNSFVQSAFLVSDKFAKHHPHLISKINDAYVNSCNFVNENPETAAELMVKNKITTSIEIAAKSIELCNIQYVAAFALFRELYSYLNVFYTHNPESIGGKIPGNDFIYQPYQ
ncbi:ABC transporter substrate-binding protein [Paludibacter sp. 221]|uniref:ABC transporter substrate-binding protein n=1 Tax=Paludibacter sp. 221 TaxID=2302939 RepID=UPI0013D36E79|nr:ABC transporter substrate-binding protein [Paludibacter sp. 221]NDV46364.1 ABC transporter substrate-binding protein [Paludibacter sp. 221]